MKSPTSSSHGPLWFLAFNLGIVLLLASAFLGYAWLTTPRWAMGYDYLFPVLGCAVSGVILIYSTREHWQKRRPVALLKDVTIILVAVAIFLITLYGCVLLRLSLFPVPML